MVRMSRCGRDSPSSNLGGVKYAPEQRREGKGREGKGREGKGREGKGREGKGREGKGREGTSGPLKGLSL